MTSIRQETPQKQESGESLKGLSRSVDAFGRTIDHLQRDYEELSHRQEELNAQLASANEKLQTALEANRRLASYLDNLLDTVPTGIIAVDSAGTVRLINRQARLLLGCESDKVLNRPYAAVWPEMAADQSSAAACAAGAVPVRAVRREITGSDGGRIALSVSTVTIPGTSEGQINGALEVFADLTAYESLQGEVARMKTLAALGEMAATVAHEIRNPLGGMIGFAELLKRRLQGDGVEDAVRCEMAQKILTGARNLNQTVERMLEFARDPKMDMREIEWEAFLTLTLDQYEETARQRGVSLKLVRRFSERLPSGRVDAVCLRQAIWNVLENAELANSDDGTIAVSAMVSSVSRIELTITDSGAGISADIADRVLLPFVTTRKKGTGLGLATARKIVEAHGGTISIGNHAEGGARVRFDLPVNGPHPEATS